jgi:hypothetical protein
MSTPETGRAQHNPDPYNVKVPVVGQANHTPLNTPLGVSPQFTTPTESWPWVQGNGNG